jgi:radical SAM-linked protein
MKAQRLRFRYSLTAEAATLGHRDIVAAWADAANAAGLAVSYSEGKRPAPQISLASPLPMGATSDAEIADIALDCRVDPRAALGDIVAHLPPGIIATAVREVGVNAPAVQASLRWAEWEVAIPEDGIAEKDVRAAIEKLLAADTWPMVYAREKKSREYDLRPLVLDVRLCGRSESEYIIRMRLRCEQDATARADQTVLALGLPAATRVHRTRLEVDDTPPAIRAYRRLGDPRADQ